MKIEQHSEHRSTQSALGGWALARSTRATSTAGLASPGDEPLRGEQTQPLPNESRNYLTGFFYGRGDALEHYVPGITPTPLHEDNDGASRHGNEGLEI